MASSSSSPQTDLSVVRTTPTPTAKTHHHHHHHSHHRTHSVGQPAHRITRRKSMSANATTIAAVAQVVSEAVHHSCISPAATGATATAGTTGLANKVGPVSPADLVPPPPPPSGYPSPPSSLPTPGPLGAAETTSDSIQQLRNTSVGLAGSAIADGHAPDLSRGARSRRASEGAGVLGPTGKIGRMRSGSELKCDKCGKGYKHSSCLTKHLWEHTPEWSYTSKLLISKHQQVQLLEAASILVSMNPTPPDSASSGASHHEGSFSANDSSSSSCEETTPPPSGSTLTSPVPTPRGIRSGAGKPGKRCSLGSSYSRSYNSVSTASLLAGSAPTTGLAFPNHLPQRPLARSRAGSNVSGGGSGGVGVRGSISPMSEGDALAAAVELLSCSFHTTPVSGSLPVGYSSDVGSLAAASGRRIFVGPLNDLVEMKKEEGEDGDDDDDDDDDVRMEDIRGEAGTPVDEDEDEDEGWSRRGRSDEEEEDGVFGHMEE